MAPSAVIFDLDGTVWDSLPWYALLLGNGDQQAADAALAELRTARPAAVLFKDKGITRAGFRRLCSGSVRVALYDRAHESLDALGRRGVPLAAVTNLPSWMA